MGCRNHLMHRQPRHIAQRMIEKLDRCRPGPCPLYGDVFHIIPHQLADARCAVDMRNDLGYEIGPGQRLQQRRGIDLTMLEAHCRADAQHRSVVQSETIASPSCEIFGLASFFGKPQISRPPATGALSSRYMAWT